MPYKRKYNNVRRKIAKKYSTTPKKVNSSASVIQAAVRRVLNKKLETKKSNTTSSDGTNISHNSFVNVDNKVLATTQGTTDPTTQAINNRIGDEIDLKGIAFKFMLENNHRYSETLFRILVVKSAKGDTPTTATLFNGLSGNKMMDTLNNERYTVIFSKYVKVKQGNFGSIDVLSGATNVGSGLYAGSGGVLSPATKIVKFYIPGYKFVGKSGKVRYENGSDQVKFFDYNVLVYAYSSYATSDALAWQVGVVNEYIKIMYFKDA